MGSRETELSQDVVFDILSSPRRRYVLYYLRTTGETVKLTDLAEQVAAWENDTAPEAITEQQRKRVYVSLYQTHVPRLAEAGVIEYDKETGDIALAEDANGIDNYLAKSEQPLPWQQLYLALAGISVILLGLTTLDISVFAAVPESVAAAVIITGFVVTAIIHSFVRLSSRRSVPDELQQRR